VRKVERVCIEVRKKVERVCIHKQQPVRTKVDIFYPQWRGTYQQWARNFVRKNYWRIENTFPDEEDALQECAVIFSHCANMYGYKVNNPKWFMSLYMRSVHNKFCRHSIKDTEYRTIIANNTYDPSYADHSADFDKSSSHNHTLSDAPLQTAISEASDEIKTLIAHLLTSPPELVNELFDRKAGAGYYLPPPDKERDRAIDAKLRYTFGLPSPIPRPRHRQPPNLVDKLRDLLDCPA
jgi:hypothetical protein